MTSKKDNIFLDSNLSSIGSFAFDQRVVSVFDDMVSRSVPGYASIQLLLSDLVLKFANDGAVLDIGCSTGETILAIHKRAKLLDVTPPKCIGFDTSSQMIHKAEQKLSGLSNVELKVADLTQSDLLKQLSPSVIVASLVLQFIDPTKRQEIINSMYTALKDGGALLLIEKTVEQNDSMNKIFIDYYHSFKKEMGYSDLEIANKRDALENVLIPCTRQQNTQMLTQAGFKNVATFFQWFNFCGFLAIK
jgi:tRNA (cmo5U34)-methyltransferase